MTVSTFRRPIFMVMIWSMMLLYPDSVLSQRASRVLMLKAGRSGDSTTIGSSQTTPTNSLDALSKKFGGEILAASQQTIDVNGSRVTLTGIRCASDNDHINVFGRYMELYGDKLAIVQGNGNSIYGLTSLDNQARQIVLELLPPAWKSQVHRLKGGEYPANWLLKNEFILSDQQVAAIGKKLNAQIADGVNQHFELPSGEKVQVNTMATKNAVAAKRLQKEMSKAAASNTILLKNVVVYEIISASQDAKALALQACQGPRNVAHYHVEYNVVPIAEGDDWQFTPAFNAFLAYQSSTGTNKSQAERKLAVYHQQFKPATSLRLQRSSRTHVRLNYAFEPNATNEVNLSDDVVHVMFDALPKTQGFPTVRIIAKYETKDRFPRSKCDAESIDSATRDRLTAATKSWPVGDSQIQKAVARVIRGKSSELEKVKAIHATVYKHIKFAGDKKGSRYGVKKVLKQRFGHCWDKSDVYVTMARAAGIPTRQIAGWVVGMSGHAWSESYIDGIGWMPIDATADQLGVPRNYLPLFSTDDGHMKFVYTAFPKITQIAATSEE